MSFQQAFAKHRPRPIYIALRMIEMLGSLLSRGYNAAVLGGSTYQTTSARSHIDPLPKHRAFINAVFFWQPDHCRWAWEREVTEAQKTLDRAQVPKVL